MEESLPTPNQPEHFPQPAPMMQDPAPVTIVREPMKVLLNWKSAARPFERKDKEFYTTAGSIIFLVCVILLFFKEFWLIMAIIALGFFYYIITTVPPEMTEHRITNKGIFTMDKIYEWGRLGRFWFEKKYGQEALMVENYIGLPPRLIILLGDQKKDEIQPILEKYIMQEKPELGQVERMGSWLQRKVNLENETKDKTKPSASVSHQPKTKS